MAEETGQEKSEEPTEKKKEDARKKGQVARSRELNAAGVMIFGSLGCIFVAERVFEALHEVFRLTMSLPREAIYDLRIIANKLQEATFTAFSSLVPLFIVLALVALIVPNMMGGWLFSWKSLEPKMSKMNPIEGLKKMFSVNGLMELVKSFSKFVLVAFFGYFLLMTFKNELINLGFKTPREAIVHGASIVGWSFFYLSMALIFIAAIDVPFQIAQNAKKLKMTKQEIKDEYKDTEGKPEVKSRIRRMQHEAAQSRMMSAVPEADVVITNPTHYAVALKYNHGAMGAPKVVAKGVDLIAEQIKRVAIEHNVTIVEAPPLARSVYYHTKLEAEIPQGLYMAVAQVLAYVYRLKQYSEGQGKDPGSAPDFDVPDDLTRD